MVLQLRLSGVRGAGKVRPNQSVNLTRNGRRFAAAGVRFAHGTPASANRLPLHAGYLQRYA